MYCTSVLARVPGTPRPRAMPRCRDRGLEDPAQNSPPSMKKNLLSDSGVFVCFSTGLMMKTGGSFFGSLSRSLDVLVSDLSALIGGEAGPFFAHSTPLHFGFLTVAAVVGVSLGRILAVSLWHVLNAGVINL